MMHFTFYKSSKLPKEDKEHALTKAKIDLSKFRTSDTHFGFNFSSPKSDKTDNKDDDKSEVDENKLFFRPDSYPVYSTDQSINSVIDSAIARSKRGFYTYKGQEIPLDETSNGHCTYGVNSFYENLGLQGSFWDTQNHKTATDTNLTSKGFDKIWEGNYDDIRSNNHLSILKPGDLIVTYGVKANGENSSHISMWNGEHFVSDFVQNNALVYPKERKGKEGKSVQILRLNPEKIQMAKQGIKMEKESKEEKQLLNDDQAYEQFLSSTPDNIRYTDPKEYRMRRYWELYGKPSDFWSAIDKTNMFNWVEKDRAFHSNSVAYNENGEIEFMKYPNHPTVHMETDWYKLGKVYPEEGEPFLLVPEHGKAYEEWQDFKKNYDLDESGEFFKYVPKKKDVPKDAEGAKIIVIEKEVIKEPEEEKDPLKCLLCQIMNAMGHRHHAFSELRPDKLTDIFGGNAEIVIQLGGPEKAYSEDSFEEMLKDILPIISTSKEYSKEDIKEIRSKKAEHGTSMKRLLSLLDDDKILKAFHGMQLFKTGGEIQFEAKGGQLENMQKINIKIGDNDFEVYEAKTDEEKRQGLKGVTDLKINEGMIFYWDEPQENVTMTMKGCKIPLKIIFFDEDQEVIGAPVCQPGEESIIMPGETKYVVELHPDAPVGLGDELDFSGEDDEYVMQVLGSDGSIQMQLKGGERIFSRPNTKILLKWAKQAYSSNNPSDYRRLGKLLFKYLDQQDNREPEYVQLDQKND